MKERKSSTVNNVTKSEARRQEKLRRRRERDRQRRAEEIAEQREERLATSSSLRQTDTIQIATWNCRGLHNSFPYIKHLISKGTDILILQEHWLWPFELDQLESIDPNYTYTCVCDNRLSPTSTLRRGCGGCAILYSCHPCVQSGVRPDL